MGEVESMVATKLRMKKTLQALDDFRETEVTVVLSASGAEAYFIDERIALMCMPIIAHALKQSVRIEIAADDLPRPISDLPRGCTLFLTGPVVGGVEARP